MDDRADRELRVEVEDELTRETDQPRWIAGLEQPRFEAAAADRAESERKRVIVRMLQTL